MSRGAGAGGTEGAAGAGGEIRGLAAIVRRRRLPESATGAGSGSWAGGAAGRVPADGRVRGAGRASSVTPAPKSFRSVVSSKSNDCRSSRPVERGARRMGRREEEERSVDMKKIQRENAHQETAHRVRPLTAEANTKTTHRAENGTDAECFTEWNSGGSNSENNRLARLSGGPRQTSLDHIEARWNQSPVSDSNLSAFRTATRQCTSQGRQMPRCRQPTADKDLGRMSGTRNSTSIFNRLDHSGERPNAQPC